MGFDNENDIISEQENYHTPEEGSAEEQPRSPFDDLEEPPSATEVEYDDSGLPPVETPVPQAPAPAESIVLPDTEEGAELSRLLEENAVNDEPVSTEGIEVEEAGDNLVERAAVLQEQLDAVRGRMKKEE